MKNWKDNVLKALALAMHYVEDNPDKVVAFVLAVADAKKAGK